MSRDSGYISGFRYEKRVTVFTADGTFTPPAGVTYAIAHIRAGGGSTGTASWATGGTSSVAFASGTISATGGGGMRIRYIETNYHVTGATNSGQGGMTYGTNGAGSEGQFFAAAGSEIVAGGAVTAGTGISITVGAGAAAGTSGAAGGSGYVWIEYLQPVGAGL